MRAYYTELTIMAFLSSSEFVGSTTSPLMRTSESVKKSAPEVTLVVG